MDLEKRNAAIYRASLSGATQREIAEEFGLTHGRISQILAEIRASQPQEDREHMIRRHSAFLQQLLTEVTELWHARPIPAYSNGRPITMPDGTMAEDHSGRLAALDRAERLHARLAKLHGLEAPAKQDVTVTTAPEDIELVQRIREWKASKAQEPE